MPAATLTAPSRLHFGLWSLGGQAGRQFGGVGAMIENPSLRLSIQDAAEFSMTGPAAERADYYARRWADFHHLSLPPCRINIERAIPEHAGLGSGTQLALSIAAALSAFVGMPDQSPQALAHSVGRGLRSAVGTYGFAFGGLIVEQGKQQEPVSPLDCRIDLPETWRFVLARQLELSGLAGEDESGAFERLPPVPSAVTDELISLAHGQMVMATATGDFDRFAEGLYRYGWLSGECFAARQGGPYNGPVVTRLVEQIRGAGYAGVGQSSWGPTVFVVVRSQAEAVELAGWLAAEAHVLLDIGVSPPANHGATIHVQDAQEVN